MTFLFFLTSCALFQGQKTLENENKEKLLEKVQLIGEGRGRLTLGQSQYLFSFDSLLKENFDWVLAVAIPLHGEEVMVLPDLRQKQINDVSMESFEARIANEFHKLKLHKVLGPEVFLKEFRSLIRFNLARTWGRRPDCQEQHERLACQLDGEIFFVSASKGELIISRPLKQGKMLYLVAKDFDEKVFQRTDIFLFTSEEDFKKKTSALSLELFWKN